MPIGGTLCMYNTYIETRDLRDTIESSPLCITDLFQNKSVAYLIQMEWIITLVGKSNDPPRKNVESLNKKKP